MQGKWCRRRTSHLLLKKAFGFRSRPLVALRWPYNEPWTRLLKKRSRRKRFSHQPRSSPEKWARLSWTFQTLLLPCDWMRPTEGSLAEPRLQHRDKPVVPFVITQFWDGLFCNNKASCEHPLTLPWLGNFAPWVRHSFSFHRITLYGVLCFSHNANLGHIKCLLAQAERMSSQTKHVEWEKRRSVTVALTRLFSNAFQFFLFRDMVTPPFPASSKLGVAMGLDFGCWNLSESLKGPCVVRPHHHSLSIQHSEWPCSRQRLFHQPEFCSEDKSSRVSSW